MHDTQFYGLTELDPGDPITVDGSSFLQTNPSVTDAILRIGAVTHRHDAHLPLPDPVGVASGAVSTADGQIAAGQSIYIAYTLIDPDLGETRRSAAVLVSTPTVSNGPQAPITAVFDPTAGTLPVGQYVYALTLNDAGGGETTLGPAAFVSRSGGYASGQMLLTGLDAEIGAGSNYVTWNLWRMQDGGQFQLLVTGGSTDAFTDTGLVCTDASRTPPVDMRSVLATNSLSVTLPTADQDPSVAGAVSYGLYLSTNGTFGNPCFYGGYPLASGGAAIDIPALTLQSGEPPSVSRASVGANLIDPDTDMLDFPWKRPVATQADLPTTGNEDGDMRLVLTPPYTIYAWDAGESTWITGGGASGEDGTPGPAGPDGPAGPAGPAGSPASSQATVHSVSGDYTLALTDAGTVVEIAAIASGSVATVASDDFVEASDTPLTSHAGETWQPAFPAGDEDTVPTVLGGDGALQGGNSSFIATSVSPSSPDYSVTIDYDTEGTGWPGLFIRYDPTTLTGYGCTIEIDGTLYIFKIPGNYSTPVIATAPSGTAPSDGTLELSASGDTITASINGTVALTATDSDYAAIGHPGIRLVVGSCALGVLRVTETATADAFTLTVPTNADVALALETLIEICDVGTVPVAIVGESGVTLDVPPDCSPTSAGQWSTLGLRQRNIDEWVLSGRLAVT